MRALLLLVWLLCSWPSQALEVKLQLNWTQGADHAPLYYALEQGWFAAGGVDLRVAPGGGSAFTLEAVEKGEFDLGIVDLMTALREWGKGKHVRATMNILVNAPHAFYWLKDSAIVGLEDFPGKRLGTLADDPARKLWRALAQDNGIDPDGVRWIDLPHQAKVDALREKRIDVATNAFFHNHAGYEAAFGANLVEVPWRTLGFNPYSNSLIAHPSFLANHPDAMRTIVRALQRAVRTCLVEPEPCLKALLRANPHLEEAPTRRNWLLVERLLRPPTPGAVVGAFDANRLRHDYDLARRCFGLDHGYDPELRALNSYLDAEIRH